MATVQLADIYNPLVFAQAEQEAQIELNRFISSGVSVRDPRIDNMASVGGNIGELPYYNPLTINEPNYSTDNPAVTSTPDNLSSSKMIYRLASQNKSWSSMDLSRELATADPVQAIANRIGQYWASINERRVIYSMRGVAADNIANDSSDMVFDISVAIDTGTTDANLVDRDAIIDALQTAGDHSSNMRVMAAHSKVISRLKKLDAANFTTEKLSNTNMEITRYGELVVITDDSLAGITYGTTPVNTYYDTLFFAVGAVGSGEGRVMVPSEMDRNPDVGNGGGESIIYSRRADILHPYGMQFTSASVAGQSASWAELATAANWDRVYDRKNVPVAILRSNG